MICRATRAVPAAASSLHLRPPLRLMTTVCCYLQVAETLPAEVLAKMGAPPKPADIPVLDTHTLPE